MTTITHPPRVRWTHVGVFLALTFALTWLLNLGLYFTVGVDLSAGAVYLLQIQMFVPAFCAIALGLFVFRDGPLAELRRSAGRPRLFFYAYLIYVILFSLLNIAAFIMNESDVVQALVLATQGLSLVGVIVLIVVRLTSGREAMARVGLADRDPKGFRKPLGSSWILFGAGFILFYAAQAALNYFLGLGTAVDWRALMEASMAGLGVQGSISPEALLAVAAFQSLIFNPLVLGLLIAFGEEYGWRGFLQTELIKLGKVKGIALLGLIWGVWHAPVILMGYNYPGRPVAGVFMMIAYSLLLAFVLGYAVLKTGNVLLAAFLHAVNNTAIQFVTLMFVQPNDPIFCFGAGIFGLASWLLVVALILRDPVWRT